MTLIEDCVSAQEAAVILNVDSSRVLVLCRQGRFAGARKFGRDWVIPRDAVENFHRLPPGGLKNLKHQHEADKAMLVTVREKLRGGMTDEHSREDSGAEC